MNDIRDKRVFSSCYGWGPGCNGRSRMFNNRRDLFTALSQPLQSTGEGDYSCSVFLLYVYLKNNFRINNIIINNIILII